MRNMNVPELMTHRVTDEEPKRGDDKLYRTGGTPGMREVTVTNDPDSWGTPDKIAKYKAMDYGVKREIVPGKIAVMEIPQEVYDERKVKQWEQAEAQRRQPPPADDVQIVKNQRTRLSQEELREKLEKRSQETTQEEPE